MSTYRLAVLSDVHGNLQALEAVFDAIDRLKIDAIIHAGDLTSGVNMNETARILRERGVIAILGNGDSANLDYVDGKAPEHMRIYRQFDMMRWTASQMEPDTVAYLRSLPEQRVISLPGAQPIRLMHGSPRGINHGIYPDQPGMLDEIWEMVDEEALIFGHTHEPWLVYQCDRLALNPGAVCDPVNGQVGAQFALLEWNGKRWKGSLYCVPYDLHAYRQAFIDGGSMGGSYLTRAFLISTFTGHDVADDFLAFAHHLAEKAGQGDLPYLTDEIWEGAGQNFPWEKWDETV